MATPMKGLGDVVAGVTKALGIRECSGCARRKAALNAAVPFVGSHERKLLAQATSRYNVERVSGSDEDQIKQVLTAAGVSPSDVSRAISGYTNIDANAINAMGGILGGGPVTLATLGPIIATGLMLSGVAAPIGAAVAAAIPVISAIAEILSPGAPDCNGWYIGQHSANFSICSNAVQPYGPNDSQWLTWDQFAQYQSDRDKFGLTPIDRAFPGYSKFRGQSLQLLQLALAQDNDPLAQFVALYEVAWKKNKEYEINGYTAIDDYVLLVVTASTWNANHSAASSVTLDGSQNAAYISELLKGNTYVPHKPMGRRRTPVPINTGALLQPRQIGRLNKLGLNARPIVPGIVNFRATRTANLVAEMFAQAYTPTEAALAPLIQLYAHKVLLAQANMPNRKGV